MSPQYLSSSLGSPQLWSRNIYKWLVAPHQKTISQGALFWKERRRCLWWRAWTHIECPSFKLFEKFYLIILDFFDLIPTFIETPQMNRIINLDDKDKKLRSGVRCTCENIWALDPTTTPWPFLSIFCIYKFFYHLT